MYILLEFAKGKQLKAWQWATTGLYDNSKHNFKISLLMSFQSIKVWQMDFKSKSKWSLNMLKVNLSHGNLNIMKLENFSPMGECFKNNH